MVDATRVEEPHQALVQGRGAERLRARHGADALHQRGSMIAAAVDQIGDAGPAQLPQGRIEGKSPRPPRPVRGPVQLIAVFAGRRQVAGGQGHGRPVRGGVADKGQAAIHRRVQPFVGVGGPRVRQFHSRDQLPARRAGLGPEAEGAVDMHPGARRPRHRDQLGVRVASADIQVGGVQHKDGRRVSRGQSRPQRLRRQTTIVFHRQGLDRAGPEAEESHRPLDRSVMLVVGQNPDARGAVEAVRLHVPAATRQQGVPGGGQAGEVGHLAAGGKGERGFGGNIEQRLQPGPGDLLHHRGSGRAGVGDGVLIPGRSQPVRGQGRRHGPADDPGEEPAAGAAQMPAARGLDQFVDHLCRRQAALTHWHVQPRAQIIQAERRRHRGLIEGVQIVDGVTRGAPQKAA